MTVATPLLAELAAARKKAGISQETVAGRTETSQENVSRLERAEDMRLTTLIRYVYAIDGELSVAVRIGDASVLLNRTAPLEPK